MSSEEIKVIVASDVSDRDGIGIEIYQGENLVVEIFRDDTKRTREVTLYKKDIPLELLEKSIEEFKEKVPWEFINYENKST